MKNEAAVWGCMIVLLVILSLLGAYADYLARRLVAVKTEAIQLGYAQYNPTNGGWEWRK